jgi:formylglycine-generating enzyme required for sulfatase activity
MTNPLTRHSAISTAAAMILMSACILNISCHKGIPSDMYFQCKVDGDCGSGWSCVPCPATNGLLVCVKNGESAPAGCTTDLDIVQSDSHDADARDLGDKPDTNNDPGLDGRDDFGTNPDSSQDIDAIVRPDSNTDVAPDDEGVSPRDTGPDICVPKCDGKNCGDDGCDGQCGTCKDGKKCVAGTCSCVAEALKGCCGNAVCWFDSCGAKGAKTADCPYGCAAAICKDCVGDCTNKGCGDDGCGVECGTCPKSACNLLKLTPGQTCLSNTCTGDSTPQDCNDGEICTTDSCDPLAGCGHTNNTLECALAKCELGKFYTAVNCSGGNCPTQTGVACDDGKACTKDLCNVTSGCANTLQGGYCLIAGTCYAEGAANGTNLCKVCTTTKSTSVWSNAIDGTTCGTGGGCVSGTCCNANDHKACSGGSVYWYDSCGNVGSLAQTCQYGCTAGVCDPSSGCPLGYVLVPSGTFTMGSPSTEPGRVTNETEHQVTISKSFCLKATEVTQGEWQALMGNNPSSFSTCGTDCPVETVSWWDSVAYCNKLSSSQGLSSCYTLTGCTGTPGVSGYTCTGVTFAGLTCTGYRLPTESEWEYAARAGTTTGTYNGTSTLISCEQPNTVLDPIAWFCGNSSSKTHAAKGKTPNAWGLYDMLGNVWEWTGDWYGTYPGTVTDPTGAPTGSYRVGRGGSWYYVARYARAASRSGSVPGDRSYILGLRPSRSSP